MMVIKYLDTLERIKSMKSKGSQQIEAEKFILKAVSGFTDIDMAVNYGLNFIKLIFDKIDDKIVIKITHLKIDDRTRIFSRENDLDQTWLTAAVNNILSRVIMLELALHGDATRTGLVMAIKNNYGIELARSTIYDHVKKLQAAGWIKTYHIKNGRPGFPSVFHSALDTGEKCNVQIVKQSTFFLSHAG